MKFALAQINPTVGDIAGNAEKILRAYDEGKSRGADIVICPELCLIGYPPEDLVLMPAFRAAAMEAAQEIAAKTKGGPALIIGAPWEESGAVYNAALFMDGGKILHKQFKTELPNYGIFDEKRIFSPGSGPRVIDWRGVKIGLLVCEDIWNNEIASSVREQHAELLIVINASPFEAGKREQRLQVARDAVKCVGTPLVYVNMVGGQDDIVFDGGSFALSPAGEVTAQLPEFKETVALGDTISAAISEEEKLWSAMKLGLFDYVKKNNFPGVILGLSGGVDSALTACIAVDALGAKNVCGVLLPSPYNSKESSKDALETAKLLGIETMTIPITAGMEIFEEVLNPVFKTSGWMDELSIGGNLQSRLRGVTLMALSNQSGFMLLATSNKSEIAVGYSTLYGDSCGGYNPLKDLYKTQVYDVANWRNKQSYVIPKRSISRAPTAELAPGQTDQDQLPPYEILDKILQHHLKGRLSAEEIIARGFDKNIVEKTLKMVRASEYKRRQSCPGPKLSSMQFTRDRRYPLTNKF